MSSSIKRSATSSEAFIEISQIRNDFTPSPQEPSDQSMRLVCQQADIYAESIQTDHGRLLKEDDASSKFLCMGNIQGNCTQDKCTRLHSDTHLPYLWQIQLCGGWFTLQNSENVEQLFCSPEEKECSFKFTSGLDLSLLHRDCTILFEPEKRAFIREYNFVEARRLSTMSFKEVGDVGDSYVTQWRWYWEDNDGAWMLFEPDSIQHTLEAKFLAKQTTYLYWRENYKWRYKIDFGSMTQQNVQTGATRPIRRRPVFVSFQDVQDNITPPCLTPPQVIDVALPTSWVPWDVAHPFELVQLSPDDIDFIELSARFFKTASPDQFTLTAVSRIQNHALLSGFNNHEKVMLNNQRRLGDRNPVDKRPLFHGTDSLNTVRGICVNNFDFRLCGKNATMYGQGAYFARDAKYSHQFTKPDENMERFMLQANVLIGYYTKGDSQYKRPPEKPDKDHELFDSCVDDEHNPSMFILFDKHAYYPEYLIQYKHSDDFDESSPQPAVLLNASNPSSSTFTLVLQQAQPPQTKTKRSRKPRSKKASLSLSGLQQTTPTSISTKQSRSKKSKTSNSSSLSNSVPPIPVLQGPTPTLHAPSSQSTPMPILNSSIAMTSPAAPQFASVSAPFLQSSQMHGLSSNQLVPSTGVPLATTTIPVLAHSYDPLSLPKSNGTAPVIASSSQSPRMPNASSYTFVPQTIPPPYSTVPTLETTPAQAHANNSLSLAPQNIIGSPWNSMSLHASNSTYFWGNPPPAHTTQTSPGYPFQAHHQLQSMYYPYDTDSE
ncbi:protein mono-ADP-ribosyltransferase PARP12-like isoform X2 [Dreissena polymorpha]|uniref:protein mono-ADP-ribosyltransferase PARP12-like isoform X2 n=1 Tax=Dreissena polymorpha TaxID=45954 RepID=UPI002263B031|nr:protein mono-ADP-ribosyltransferase PARP12-like isoform X2 [Dreissena polymorpha]